MRTNTRFEILTPNGWSSFSGVRKTTKTGSRTIVTASGKTLECTLDHMIQDEFGWVESNKVKCGDLIKTQHGYERVISTYTHESKTTQFYDAIDVIKDKEYYTNGILSHNCEFLGSSNTLIDAKKLQQLTWKDPLHRYDDLDVYEEPQDGHKYFMTVDVSRGSSIDYSAFLVFDVTSVPYRLVAKYRNNEIAPLLYPNIIWRAGKWYNDALVLIEVNDNGQQIADILFYDLEYEGVVMTQTKGRAGIKMGGGYKVKPIRGIRQTKQTKRIGCANFKSLVESDKLIFNDYDLIYELFRFVENKASYEAEEGQHDDLVMCGVMFGWAVAQKYFINQSDTDVRLDLWAENREIIEQSVAPFGILTSGWNEVQDEVSPPDAFNSLDFHPSWYDPEYGPITDF